MKNILKNYFWWLSKIKLRAKPTIIGITGSAGKTSTKFAISTLLIQKYKVVTPEGNLNTEFGVAYAILNLKMPQNRVGWIINIVKGFFSSLFPIGKKSTVILELGADRPGDILFFSQKLKFNFAVLTNIGSAHLENFNSKQELIEEKLNLLKAIKSDGFLIYNIDDPTILNQFIITSFAKKISFGKNGDCEISNIKINLSGISAILKYKNNQFSVQLPTLNQSLFWSLSPALVLGINLNLTRKQIEYGLRNYKIENGRGRILIGIKNTTIIDHTYNANPSSLNGIILSLEKLQTNRRKIAILGDMKELGSESKYWHERLGLYAKNTFDKVYTFGNEAKHYGLKNFIVMNDLINVLLKEVTEGDIILIIGSQVARLEKVVEILLEDKTKAKNVLVRQSNNWKNQ